MLPTALFAASEEDSVTNYPDFLAELKQLEVYAADYCAMHSSKSAGELVLNFIRTGVDRYLDGNWSTLAGAEITDFTAYVEKMD